MIRAGRAVLLSLAVATAAALSLDGHAEVGGQVDLSGDWTISIEGDVSLTCTVTAVQTGTDVSAQLNCPSVSETPLVGDIDPLTRSLFLDLSGETGLDVELHGMVSEDGNSVDGTWGWSADRLTGTFHAVRGVTPPAIPDISGSWHIEMAGDSSGYCTGTAQQNGSAVQLDLQCPDQPSTTLTGQINDQVLTLSGPSFYRIEAAVSHDGYAIGGSWIGTPCCAHGPFTGLKEVDRTFDGDVTGDWQISITGGLYGTCNVAVQQSDNGTLFAAFDCGGAGGWWLRGAMDRGTGTFALQGTGGSRRDYQIRIRGLMSDDAHSFIGNFAGNTSSYWLGGTLEGHQIDNSPSFMDINGQYTTRLISKLGERVPCYLPLQQTQEVLAAQATCAGVGSGTVSGWVSPLTAVLHLEGTVGNVELTFDGTASNDGGLVVLQGQWRSNRRFVLGCFTTDQNVDCQQAGRDVPGDANCDGRTNSLDAALVLQVSAGLLQIENLSCSSNVYDLRLQCCPVTINALDALIVLQLDAGLLGRLAR